MAAALLGVLSPGGAIWLAAAARWLSRRAACVRERREAFRPQRRVRRPHRRLLDPPVRRRPPAPADLVPLTDNDAKGNLVEAARPAPVRGHLAGRATSASSPTTRVGRLPADRRSRSALAVVGRLVRLAPRRLGAAALRRRLAARLRACSRSSARPGWPAKATAIASPAVSLLGPCRLRRRLSTATARRRLGGDGRSRPRARRGRRSGRTRSPTTRCCLAPRDQLAELEEIGELIAGEGPALMTEYQPYGVRHFLREADAEGISELRRHRDPAAQRAHGREGRVGRHRPGRRSTACSIYRTLVLRRTPEQSRPPLPYELVYERRLLRGLAAGGRTRGPASTCRSATGSTPGRCRPATRSRSWPGPPAPAGELLAAPAPRRRCRRPTSAGCRPAWTRRRPQRALVLGGSGEATFAVRVGDARPLRSLAGGLGAGPRSRPLIDGEPVGSVRHQLNNSGLYLDLGDADLDPGRHELTLQLRARTCWPPGSGGPSPSVGPLVLSMPGRESLVTTPAERYRRLCGRRWDWIEGSVAP